MADSTVPSVSVLCAYPVSTVYNFNHRSVYYAALAVVLLAPRHRWITPAAFAFLTLYTAFSTIYIGALHVAPTRLGPTMDIFSLNSIFLTNTYALAAAVFCRSTDLIKGKRGWLQCTRAFVWTWVAFVASSMGKASFEKWADKATVQVQCFAENTTATNIFSIGKGLACENPCAIPSTSAAYQFGEQLSPIVWGRIDEATQKFSKTGIPGLSVTEYVIVILFATALAGTLWTNFFTSPQITRNTIFAALTKGKGDSRVRVFIAKVAALSWYTWSYFALLLVALAVPFVSWIQEMLLARYPVTKTTCLMREWIPWVIGVALFLVKVALWRRRREVLSKEKACRIKRFNTALRQLQGKTDPLPLLPKHNESNEVSDDSPVEAAITPPSSDPASVTPAPKKLRIEIAETRKVRGLLDTACELKEWWLNPAGIQDEACPSADEEKALLEEHYNGE